MVWLSDRYYVGEDKIEPILKTWCSQIVALKKCDKLRLLQIKCIEIPDNLFWLTIQAHIKQTEKTDAHTFAMSSTPSLACDRHRCQGQW